MTYIFLARRDLILRRRRQFRISGVGVPKPTRPEPPRVTSHLPLNSVATMLPKHGALFFTPSCIVRSYPLSQSPLHRHVLFIPRNPQRLRCRRTYATQRPDFDGSTTNGSGGIPIGKINLGSAKAGSQKGIAIKDDITKSWKELSLPQKIVRTGTQTTNFAVVILGVGVLVLRRRSHS